MTSNITRAVHPPAQRPPALEQLVTKPRKRRQRTETTVYRGQCRQRGATAGVATGDSQASSAASFQEANAHSPKYDEVGFSASASWTKRSGATPADRRHRHQRAQAPEGPECLRPQTHPSHSPDSNQRGPSPRFTLRQKKSGVNLCSSLNLRVRRFTASGRPAGRRRSDVSQVSATTQQTQRMSQTGFKHGLPGMLCNTW